MCDLNPAFLSMKRIEQSIFHQPESKLKHSFCIKNTKLLFSASSLLRYKCAHLVKDGEKEQNGEVDEFRATLVQCWFLDWLWLLSLFPFSLDYICDLLCLQVSSSSGAYIKELTFHLVDLNLILDLIIRWFTIVLYNLFYLLCKYNDCLCVVYDMFTVYMNL